MIVSFSWTSAGYVIWGLASGLGRKHNQQLYSNAMLSLSKNSLHVVVIYELLFIHFNYF